MNRRAATAALVISLFGALMGCSAARGAPAQHTTTAPASSSGSSPSPSSPTPMLTPTARAGTPLGTGERVWAAFSERGLAYDAWWAQLRPLLSDSARAVYVYDDPRRIPSMKLTAKIHLAAKPPDDPRFTAEVIVPTSKGTFRLDLERHTVTSRWLLYAIKFPATVH